MLKLVFVDMDGTFLNSAKKITPENLAAMDLAAQKGVQRKPAPAATSTAFLSRWSLTQASTMRSAVTAPSSVMSAPAAFCTRLA